MSAPGVESLSSRKLISALTDPLALHGLRGHFAGSEPDMGRLRPLVVELIDPKLLRVALGPDVGPVWASSLQRVYDAMREMQPTDFHDVDASWKRQRGYWRSILRSARQAMREAEEAEAEVSASAGAHGAVADVTVGAPHADTEIEQDPRRRGKEDGSGRRRVRQLSAFGEAPDPDPDVESIVPPLSDDSEIGDVGPEHDDEFDRGRASRGASSREASVVGRSGGGRQTDLVPPGVAAGGRSSQSRPVVRRSGAAPGGGRPQSSAGGARAADPGAAVVQLVAAMLHSPQAVDRLRREWIASCGSSTAWDRWSLPPAVADVVRERRR